MPVVVRSIRKVEWGNFSTNFYFILSPGSLDGAPMTYVATVRVQAAQELPLQQALVGTFPNVTTIHIGEVMVMLGRLLEHVSLAVRAVAFLCVLAGAVVMAAALTATRHRRSYESVLLKALGATRGLIARVFTVEYGVLGLAAGVVGVLLACALSWALLYFVFDQPWVSAPFSIAVALPLTVLLTMAVGVLSTWRLLRRRPLAVLRDE